MFAPLKHRNIFLKKVLLFIPADVAAPETEKAITLILLLKESFSDRRRGGWYSA